MNLDPWTHNEMGRDSLVPDKSRLINCRNLEFSESNLYTGTTEDLQSKGHLPGNFPDTPGATYDTQEAQKK